MQTAPMFDETPCHCHQPVQTHPKRPYTVVLKSDRLGEGDDALGRMLMKGYLNTLKELEHKPIRLILYNGGAQLAAHQSGADTALQALEQGGVDIIICGSCVEYFELQSHLAAGRITNMYDIANTLATADHVVYP